VSFAIANNLLTPNNRATDLKITPQAIQATWNNFKNPKDGSFSMKHLKRYSCTILESPLEDKWVVVVEAWANKIYPKQKCV
jgi:hypothetical protein